MATINCSEDALELFWGLKVILILKNETQPGHTQHNEKNVVLAGLLLRSVQLTGMTSLPAVFKSFSHREFNELSLLSQQQIIQ